MPPLLADFIYSSDCKLICEKSLTLPPKLCQFLRFYKTVHRTILQKEKPTHDRFTLNTSVSSSDLNGHIQLWQIRQFEKLLWHIY